jgi:Breast carcinoma amplified sequence 2 (BCAS2)
MTSQFIRHFLRWSNRVWLVCGAMSSSVPSATVPITLDALPYVDAIHEDYEVYALALVEEEMAKISPSATTTCKLPPLRASVLLQTEYEFVSKGEKTRSPPLELNDVHPPPPSDNNTAEAWKESIHRARAAYESERLRGQVLELEEKYAPTQWKRYTNQVLQPLELLKQ